jgi:LAO/AO transport system kinase
VDPKLQDLLDRFGASKTAALARIVSLVENRSAGFEELLTALHPSVGNAQRIGITGPPGAGKSTLTDAVVARYRAMDKSVAVVAVDPTSPFSGGALLGDRVRMDSVSSDPNVFIRSMATRGAAGGLAMTTLEVCDVLDAYGFDRIIVETVGVGQSELAVAATTDMTVLVLVPESGDSVQVLKAGVMEVGDVFVVNKSDRPKSDRMAKDLEEMLAIRTEAHPDRRVSPVVKTVASQGTGVDELVDALEDWGEYLAGSGELATARKDRRLAHARSVTEYLMTTGFWEDPARTSTLADRGDAMMRGELSAYQVARLIIGNGNG